MLVEEVLGLGQVALLQETRVGFEHLDADEPADPITDLPAEDRGDRHEDEQLPQRCELVDPLLAARGDNHARNEQQGITGKNREQHAGLDEHDEEQPPECPGPEPAEDIDGVEDAG